MKNVSFLMWLRKRAKAKDKGASIAGNILDYGKPIGKRNTTLDDWKKHLKESDADLGAKRGCTRLYKEYTKVA
jgi:hypothetical protein